jgi:hypothetical protein
MNAHTNGCRLIGSVACALLLAGCAAGTSATPTPATPTPTPLVTPEVAASTPAPSPTAAPAAMASSPQPSSVYGDSSTAVSIHIEKPDCVTKPEEAGTTDVVNGVRQMRGWGRHCRYDAADPRFSGWSDIVVNSDCYLADYSRCVRWGTERIPGPDGDWAGSFLGGQLGGGIRFNYEVLVGTGAYTGWNYVSYMNMAALGGEEWVIDGFIYRGPPPPFPEPSAPASAVYDGSTAVDIHIQEGNPPAWGCETDAAPATTYVNGVKLLRGATRHCRYDGADPRFSGLSDVVLNADCHSVDSSMCVRWGTERIPGPVGDWVGTYTGGSIGTGSGWRGNFEILEGTGAYEGWTFVVYQDQAALGGQEWVSDGFIYHGPPPPVPPLPSPSSG